MPKLTYRIENAPGKIYGKNANELIFKEPASGAVVYSTTTASSMMKSTKKHLFRGPVSEKEGGVCVATIDEPHSGTLQMHHRQVQSPTTKAAAAKVDEGEDSATTTTSSTLKMKKTSSWVPFSGKNNHAVTFRDAKYTWSGATQLKRDSDGHVVAKVAGPWFWQGKLGDMEVDITSSSDTGKGETIETETIEDREILEMVLATFVLRWWGEKISAEEEVREKKRQQEEAKKERELEKAAVASQKKEQEEKKKQADEAAQSKQDADDQNSDQQTGKL